MFTKQAFWKHLDGWRQPLIPNGYGKSPVATQCRAVTASELFWPFEYNCLFGINNQGNPQNKLFI